MKYYSLKSSNGELIAQNLMTECENCLSKSISIGSQLQCPKFGMLRRQGIIKNNKSTTFLCCDETKTTKLFRNKLEGLSYAYDDLLIPREKYDLDAKKNEQLRVNRLVHNLTSINAHNIQEIYDLVPQEILTSNYASQLDYIQKEIKRDVRKAALMFLRIAKHNIHMKSEFSIYKKLDRSDKEIEFKNHPIQKVLLNVLHTFFVDFTNNGIFVKVENYFGNVRIDYETIQVAIYHLIENASKYAKPETNILIQFRNIEEYVEVSFTMTSLFVEDDEVEKIFEESYSGKAARQANQHGDGIGMWRINQMLNLNKGFVKFLNGKNKLISQGLTYGENQIVLKFIRA